MSSDLSISSVSTQTSPTDKINASRAGRILLGPCVDLLRDILRENVRPDDFNDVIRQKSDRLPFLTPTQREKVLPQNGQYFGNYIDMDLSLIYILLTSVTEIQPHSQGWGKDPDPGDRSVSSNIDRILIVRNILGYWTSESLPQIDFEIIWSAISQAVEDLDVCYNFGSKYIKEMDCLRYKEMDPERDVYYMEELQRQVKYSQDISPWYASTANTTNATRASRVLLGPCSDQLRDVLRKTLPLSEFPAKISCLRLTPSQKKILVPGNKSYCGNYNDMDITLLYFLLRNIPNLVQEGRSTKWGKDPDPSDRSLLANIERIRMLRNKIVHSTQTLSHTEFQNFWSTVKSTVVDLDNYLNNGNKYGKVVDFLRKETMDPERDRHYLEKIQNQVEEDQETRHMIKETNKRVVSLEVEQQKQEVEAKKTKKMMDETNRRVDSMEKSYKDQQQNVESLQKVIKRNRGEIEEHNKVKFAKMEANFQGLERKVNYIKNKVDDEQSTSDEEPDLNRLKERLVKINDLEIPLTPLQEDSDKLPVEQLFASVIIKEDSKETRKGKRSAKAGKEQERKEVKTPEDMLTKHGKPVRRVYMLGDAAHGKTTYCTWLLKKWCNAQTPGMSGRPLNEWENALSQFHFVFHLKFRHVDPSRANVTDMICQDILGEDTGLHTAAKHVLSSDKYRCLIIMDGLDEWKSDQLKHKGMPYIDNMSNCVIFTTMRPWMFAAVAGLVRDEDRVIEIQGLDDKGIEDVIEQVLVHYYEMKPDSDEYKAKYKEIISKLKDKTLKSFIHIPLLAVVCIQIWCEGEQVGDSLTSFYVAMVNMLIERAQLKNQIPKLSLDTTNLSLPRILSAKKNINSFSNVLLKLGKVAYEGLISNQMKIVFQKDNLESEIGERELKFALDVGLISQTEAPSITTRKVNVHFFHKSVQEFLAVIYIVTQKKVSDNFCTRLCNVKVIMELSNVIMFICGMCPSLSSVISQHVVSVTDSDGEICKYRESTSYNDTVRQLYKLQVKWYRELQYGQTDSPVTQTDSPVTFHVSDVHLDIHSDTETVRVTREVLSGHHDIRSLTLLFVPTDGERGITDTELDDFLSNTDKTRSLVKLCIYGDGTVRSVHTLCEPSLRTLYLRHVTIQDRDSVRPVITHTDRLQRVKLWDVSLGDRGLGLTSHMTDLQKVWLYRVSMTQSGWGRLIQSVIDIHHQFVVELWDTDIDSDSVSTLHSSPHISVVISGRDIKFTRVWPLTQDTQ